MGTRIDFNAPSGPAQDFWRTPTTAGALPDGVNDVTEDIARTGNVGIGSFLAAPIAKLDVAVVGRSGADGRVAGVTPSYITGNYPAWGGVLTPPATPVGGSEFRHTNQTQGFGITYDGMYSTGSNANQDINFMNRGAAQYFFYQQALVSGFNFYNWVSPAIAANEGWQHRYWAANVQEHSLFMRRSTIGVGGTSGFDIYWQMRDAAGTFRNAMHLRPSVTHASTFSLTIDENLLNDAKLVLFGTASTAFFGMGVKGSTLASFVSSGAGHFRWYQGASPGVQVFGVSGAAVVTVDPLGANTGANGAGTLRFGSETSTEWIGSKRNAGGNQNGLDFGTANAIRIAIRSNGLVNLSAASRPVFATDALAGAGGLVAGDIYRDPLGTLKVKL